MLKHYVAIVGACFWLIGCTGEFNGSYAGDNGMGTYAVMTVNGNSARIESIGRMRGDIKWADDFDADVREGKLVLSNGPVVFVYGLGVDEESLDCLSKSCQGFAGLGAAGMPRTWKPFTPSKGTK
jgi:hypothetical protein|tara:strand:- start:1541 stop:1915 length:375 start_codon:yes stop_codon:yes gene_type:complete